MDSGFPHRGARDGQARGGAGRPVFIEFSAMAGVVGGSRWEKERKGPEREIPGLGAIYKVGRVDPPIPPSNLLATACRGSTERATKVADDSVTASSMLMPEPSFRISTPKILAEVMAPYSLAADSVMSKGSTWSEYQGVASSFRPPTSESDSWSIWSMLCFQLQLWIVYGFV